MRPTIQFIRTVPVICSDFSLQICTISSVRCSVNTSKRIGQKLNPQLSNRDIRRTGFGSSKALSGITGCPTDRRRLQLLASALRYRDAVTSRLFDEDGNIRKSTRRLWPQTEIAKAWIAQAEAGEADAVDEALEALAWLYRHYLRHPVLGGWYDQFDHDNRSLVDFIRESSFYHILCAIAEAERVVG
jgi:hypothetical protein